VNTMTSESGSATPVLLFRRAFRRHPSGVAVVTVGGSAPTGFTATSVVSLSATPPLLTFNIATTASSWPALERAGTVGVHMLSSDQTELARIFATSSIDRLAAVPGWAVDEHGTPVLPGVASRLAARIHDRILIGDQAVVVAEIVGGHASDVTPLLYHDRTFTRPA
jgi:flavin reductase (DIM6/NTAB) family NADH-FMN oxidoreductase RutF